MRDGLAVLQLHSFVRQQAQTPTSMSLGRSGTSEGRNLGALCAINPDGSSRAWLIEQGGVKARAQITPLDVEDGLERNLQRGGYGCRVLTAMQEVENPGAGLRSGSRRPAFDDGCQRAKLVLA